MLQESKFVPALNQVPCYENVERNRGIAKQNLNLGIRWRSVLPSSPDLFTPRKELSVPTTFGGEENRTPLSGIEHRILGYPTHSLVTTPTDWPTHLLLEFYL
jgi:hypothetical protein